MVRVPPIPTTPYHSQQPFRNSPLLFSGPSTREHDTEATPFAPRLTALPLVSRPRDEDEYGYQDRSEIIGNATEEELMRHRNRTYLEISTRYRALRYVLL